MDQEILTAYCRSERDTSPLQFISAQLLEHYRRCEAELAAITARQVRVATCPDSPPIAASSLGVPADAQSGCTPDRSHP